MNEVQGKVISFFLCSVYFDFPKLPGCQISTFYPQSGIRILGQLVLTDFFLCCVGPFALNPQFVVFS